MKKFRINVNGKSYDVEVEEIGGSVAGTAVSAASPAPAAPTAPKTAAPVAAQPAAAPAPAVAAQPAVPVAAGTEVITAPMPGKVMSFKVSVGQKVKEGDIILILEAMKMENEIFCSTAGTVKEIRVNEGAAVNPGDVLVVIG